MAAAAQLSSHAGEWRVEKAREKEVEIKTKLLLVCVGVEERKWHSNRVEE